MADLPSKERASAVEAPLQELVLRALYDDAARGVLLTNTDGTLRDCNIAAAQLLGYEQRDLIGRRFNDFTFPEDQEHGLEVVREMLRGERDQVTFEKRYVHRSGGLVWVSLHVNPLRDERGAVRLFVASIEDITARKQAELERQRAAERVIAAQREALRQLSTPLIPITDEILALPLIGDLDAERAQLLLDTLLGAVAAKRTRAVLLDITGIARVDRVAAELFVRVSRAARLLGAEVILTGIGPDVARDLVALEVDLHGMRTLGSFQRAVSEALQERRNPV